MAYNLSHNETLLAQQLGRDQASAFLDYDGTRGEFVFDSNRMTAAQAGVALEAYLQTLSQEWDEDRVGQHLTDLLTPSNGVLDKLRPWLRHQSIESLVAATARVATAKGAWARLVNRVKCPVLDVLLVAQMEQGVPGTGVLALSSYAGFADWLVRGLDRKPGELGNAEKLMERAKQDGMLETAWACALAGCLLNPRADLRRSDLQRLVSSFSRLDDKTFQAISGRITIEQMENVDHSIAEAATRLSSDQLQALEQGWSKIKSFRLRQIAGKASAHSQHVRKM